MKKRLKRMWVLFLEELALLSLEFIIVILFGMAAAIGFIYLSYLLTENNLTLFDQRVTGWVQHFSSTGMTHFMKGITLLSNREFVIFPAAIVFIYFLFIKPHRWYSIKIPVVTAGSAVMNVILKEWFDRPRPVLEHMVEVSGLSFPSGHAMFSFSFYGLLLYISWNYLPQRKGFRMVAAGFFLLLIFLIGISRIYLGVHFPSDVFAGFAAGFLWLFVSVASIRYIERFIRRREKASVGEEFKEVGSPKSEV